MLYVELEDIQIARGSPAEDHQLMRGESRHGDDSHAGNALIAFTGRLLGAGKLLSLFVVVNVFRDPRGGRGGFLKFFELD